MNYQPPVPFVLHISSVSITLKLKFDCKIKLVVESGSSSFQHSQEPSLANNKAVFNQSLQIQVSSHLMEVLMYIKQIVMNVFVISSRNKYKAGVCRIELDNILGQGREVAKEIECKLEQCPDKEAWISMKIKCEAAEQRKSMIRDRVQNVGNNWSRVQQDINRIRDKDRDTTSIISINDLGKLADFNDGAKVFGIESSTDRRIYSIKDSVQLMSSSKHNTDRIDKEVSNKRISDLIDRPANRVNREHESRMSMGYQSSSSWMYSKLNRASFTPKIQNTMSLELKKIESKMTKQRPNIESFPSTTLSPNSHPLPISLPSPIHSTHPSIYSSSSLSPDLLTQNKLLKTQLVSLKQSIKQIQHQSQIKQIELFQLQKRYKLSKQQLQTQTLKSRSYEQQLSSISSKYKQSKQELKQKTILIESSEKKLDVKLIQYKEEIEKVSFKMLKIENENQNLLFEINELKDELLIKNIDFNNQKKSTQFELVKNGKSIGVLNGKVEELNEEVLRLVSENQKLKFNELEYQNTLILKNKEISNNELEMFKLKQSHNKQLQALQQMKQKLNNKQILIHKTIKILQQINIKNDEMKVQSAVNITENQILSILSTISKFIKNQIYKQEQLLLEVKIKNERISHLEQTLKDLQEINNRNSYDNVNLNNLYQQTKFRLEVQITNNQILEQELFNAKSDLELEKQNRKDKKYIEERVQQLESENEELLGYIHRIQKQRNQYYNYNPPSNPNSNYNFNILEPEMFQPGNRKHKYKDSRASNYSDQEEIRNIISHLQFPTGGEYQSSSILESPIRPNREVSIVSEEIMEIYQQTQF